MTISNWAYTIILIKVTVGTPCLLVLLEGSYGRMLISLCDLCLFQIQFFIAFVRIPYLPDLVANNYDANVMIWNKPRHNKC